MSSFVAGRPNLQFKPYRTDSVSSGCPHAATRARASCYDAAMDDSLSHDLAQYLDGLPSQPESDYQVDRVLKRSDREVTEVVYLIGSAGGELGPFVRKRFINGAGPGPAYERIWNAQRAGQRFLHLPRILSIACDGDASSVLMEWVPGETLDEFVAKHGASLNLAKMIFPSLCDAVGEFHGICEPPLVHRDLTPSNIIIGPKGIATLIDFGIARQWNPQAEADTSCLGTRGYAPPEQFGFGQTDARSDVYALGMILHRMATGADPHPGARIDSSSYTGAARPLEAVVRKAISLDPQARFSSAEEVKSAFLAACANEGNGIKEGSAKPGKRPSRREENRRASKPRTRPFVSKPRIRPFASWYDDAPRKNTSRKRRLLPEVPTWLGRLWNIGIAIFFIFAEIICIIAMVSPDSAIEGISQAMSSLLFLAFVGLPSATISYLLLDRRRLRRRFPIMDAVSYRKQAIYLIGGTMLIAFALLLIAIVMYNLGPAAR